MYSPLPKSSSCTLPIRVLIRSPICDLVMFPTKELSYSSFVTQTQTRCLSFEQSHVSGKVGSTPAWSFSVKLSKSLLNSFASKLIGFTLASLGWTKYSFLRISVRNARTWSSTSLRLVHGTSEDSEEPIIFSRFCRNWKILCRIK